jgi:hypothetical protein
MSRKCPKAAIVIVWAEEHYLTGDDPDGGHTVEEGWNRIRDELIRNIGSHRLEPDVSVSFEEWYEEPVA